MSQFTQRPDLTRWNRAGLSRFRYVDGNAVTFTETLRQALEHEYQGKSTQVFEAKQSEQGESETASQHQARLVQQYGAPTQDISWEIMRCFARSSHVLAEYLDTYANESYLRTATQWSSVRKLVDALGYQPAPAASAQTLVAIIAANLAPETDASTSSDDFSSQNTMSELAAGFAVKNAPQDGSPPVIFETLEAIELDPEINLFRCLDWDRSQQPLDYDSVNDRVQFPVSELQAEVYVGQLGYLDIQLAGTSHIYAVSVHTNNAQNIELQLLHSSAIAVGTTLADTTLHLGAKDKLIPKLRGDNTISLSSGHGLNDGAHISWAEGRQWRAAKIVEIENNRAFISGPLPPVDSQLFRLSSSDVREFTDNGSEVARTILPLAAQRQRGALFDQDLQKITSYSTKYEDGQAVYSYVNDDSANTVFYIPKDNSTADAESVATVTDVSMQTLSFDGKNTGLVSEQVVLINNNIGISAQRTTRISELEEGYEVTVTGQSADISMLYANFSVTLRPAQYQQNLQPVFLTDQQARSTETSTIALDFTSLPDSIEVGRKLILQGRFGAMQLTIVAVDRHLNRITVSPPIPGSEPSGTGTNQNYTKYHSVLYGNAVTAGHGETQAQKIIGSGNAMMLHQVFELETNQLSYLSDPSFASGVRADIDVQVDQRFWTQVDNFSHSSAEDHHYQLRFNDAGDIQVEFGNGFQGRRLPSGTNNVRAQYRTGSGLQGNMPAAQLSKAVKPNPLVETVIQPIPTAGGNEAQTTDSIREQAPATLLSLQRAVSLADFDHLTSSNSGVWQAKAVQLSSGLGRKSRVEVAVLPAGGGELGTLKSSLISFLNAHALPGVEVSIIGYQGLRLGLDILLRVNQDSFKIQTVEQQVLAKLYERFSLSTAKFAISLFHSDVVSLVESVEGVENCRCEINKNGFLDQYGNTAQPRSIGRGTDGLIKRVTLSNSQTLALDPLESDIQIVSEAFQR